MTTLICPLCGIDFAGANCHTSCPLADDCKLVRCPACGYEFVSESTFATEFVHWLRRKVRQRCSSG